MYQVDENFLIFDSSLNLDYRILTFFSLFVIDSSYEQKMVLLDMIVIF